VTRVAGASANLVFSKTLAKLLKAPDVVGSPVLAADCAAGVKLVL
jgi:spore germination protein GerM